MLRQLPTADNEDWAILLSAFRHNTLLLIREKTNNCDLDAGVLTRELIGRLRLETSDGQIESTIVLRRQLTLKC